MSFIEKESKKTKIENIGFVNAINGSIIQVKGFKDQALGDMVEISKDMHLTGEIIKIVDKIAIVQCYEETNGLELNSQVINFNYPLSMELGPGLLSSIYDGIQRPLENIAKTAGDFITRGIRTRALDYGKIWHFTPSVKIGDHVSEGDFVGSVPEFSITHNIMVPPSIRGEIVQIEEKDLTIIEPAYSLKLPNGEIKTFPLLSRWPIRIPRAVKRRLMTNKPMITGTRVFDLLFPVSQGGVTAVPGGFGTGKTVVQHSLAKFADADVIVYIGCGERGNEMADLLGTFPYLEDPSNHRPLMERTIMIANTSNMPVSAREASIFSGITMAEYWRDMGKNVLLLADSTSRWAEALREISGRLEEMPAQGGFPAYLATKLAAFYERAGASETLASTKRIGSITIVGAVSPPGGDFSEPVTTNTKRFVKAFWALDARLAYARHYPSVNTQNSYSLYDNLANYWEQNIRPGWQEYRTTVNYILSKANELQSIARLVGEDALPPSQQMILFASDLINNGFLIQNGFDENDKYSSPMKTMRLIELILRVYYEGLELIERSVPMFKIKEMECVNSLRRARLDISPTDNKSFDQLEERVNKEIGLLRRQYMNLVG